MDRVLNPEADGHPLPPLRDDLEIIKGAPLANGAPTWVIHDPASDRYYEIGREILDQLSLWNVGSVERLRKALCSEYGRDVAEDEVKSTIHFLFSNGLLRDIPGGDYGELVRLQKARKKSIPAWLAHGYLFFRVPLFRPDRFLRLTWPYVRPLFTRAAALIFALIGLFGLYLVSRQWEYFADTFQHLLSLEGMMLYIISLVLVKSIHELGHAYMATKYGLRVPTIGVAFIVMMPVLYTDTSAAWRLPSRRQRLMIDAAGIFSELAVAALATLAWAFLPDGGLRSIAFTTATVGWLSSLAINLNPLMRFDGYYLLADALGVQNLQERGFEMARWRLRQMLFKTDEAPPELLGVRMRRTIIVHAWATWIYRFFLFLGIALLVYTFFIKIVGIVLFILEIGWFIILPIGRELGRWWSMRSSIVKTRRTAATLVVLGLVAAAVMIPWSTRIAIPSILVTQQEIKIYPPYPARIAQMNISEGANARAGDLLMTFDVPELAAKLVHAKERRAILDIRLNRIGADEQDRAERIVLINRLKETDKEIDGLNRQIAELDVVAKFDGVIVDLDPELRPDMWVGMDRPLALLHNQTGFSVRGYIDEANLNRIREGADARFVPEDPALDDIPLQVASISTADAGQLNEAYLALRYGGSIETSQADGEELTPTGAYYTVLLRPGEQQAALKPEKVVRGNTFIQGEPRSFFDRAKTAILRVMIREMGV